MKAILIKATLGYSHGHTFLFWVWIYWTMVYSVTYNTKVWFLWLKKIGKWTTPIPGKDIIVGWIKDVIFIVLVSQWKTSCLPNEMVGFSEKLVHFGGGGGDVGLDPNLHCISIVLPILKGAEETIKNCKTLDLFVISTFLFLTVFLVLWHLILSLFCIFVSTVLF